MANKLKMLLIAASLVLVTLTAGCDNTGSPQTPTYPNGTAQQQNNALAPNGAETMQLTVYFATADAMHLTPETWVVPKSAHPAKAALEILLQKPKHDHLLRVMPEGTLIKGVTIKDHIAYVDFNDKLVKNNVGGSATEMLIVGSIVNTLTEFPEIYKVQIMVEGQKVDTLSGHMDVSDPLSRSEQMIKKSL